MTEFDDFEIFDQKKTDEIRNLISRADKKDRLPQQVRDFILERRLFKLFVPEKFNGRMTPLPDALTIFEDCALVDGSFGWSVCIGAGGGYFTGYVNPEVAKKMFSPKEMVIAGSGSPAGVAMPSDKGYKVGGRWKYCSGADYASMFTANCIMQDDKESIKSFILLPDEVEIIKDWNAYGMKATASYSMKVEELLVGEDRMFDLDKIVDDYGCPIYRFPFLLFAQFSFTAVVLGIWSHFIVEAGAIIQAAQKRWEQESPRRYPFMRNLVEEQEATFDEAAEIFYETVDQTWDKFCDKGTLSDQVEDKDGKLCCRVSEIAFDSASRLFYNLGMTAIMEDEPINRIWRDLTTAVQHILLKDY